MSGIDDAATTMPVEPVSITAPCRLPPNDSPRCGGFRRLPPASRLFRKPRKTPGLSPLSDGRAAHGDVATAIAATRAGIPTSPQRLIDGRWVTDMLHLQKIFQRAGRTADPLLLCRRVFSGQLRRDRRKLLAVPFEPCVARPGALEIIANSELQATEAGGFEFDRIAVHERIESAVVGSGRDDVT